MSESRVWTIDGVLRWAADDFRGRGIESPRLDAELLLARALETTRIQLIVEAARVLDPPELARFRELVKRRRAHEPMAYILGEREFYGRLFRVDRRVLVPRPDSETLVDVALDRTRSVSMSMRALDLCTGSGCIAITLARERPTSRVVATDASASALDVARDNALRLGAYNVAFLRSELFAAVDATSRFDLIAANPPYIPTGEIETLAADIRDFEPPMALDGGGDGLSIVRLIVENARGRLAKDGVLAVEVGAGQAQSVAEQMRGAGLGDVDVRRDYGRIERVVSGVVTT